MLIIHNQLANDLPYLSSVLHSRRAIQVNIAIMRTFVHLRRLIAADKDLAKIVLEHERKIQGLTTDVQSIYDVIQRLTDGPSPIKKIGFQNKNV